jgi:hypothetical protein
LALGSRLLGGQRNYARETTSGIKPAGFIARRARMALMPPGKSQLCAAEHWASLFSVLCQLFTPSRNQSNSDKIGQIQTKV